MFVENLDAFFHLGDFAVTATALRHGQRILGILHAPAFEAAIDPGSLNGQAFTFVTATHACSALDLNDHLAIGDATYSILQQTHDGTGLSYLMLEQLN